MKPLYLGAAAVAIIASQPAMADTYTKANFSGGVFPGNANVVSPFTGAVSPGQSLSGSFIYDNALVPAGGTGFVNVFQGQFPDVAGFTDANLFTFNLGSVVLTAADLSPDSLLGLGIQYNNGNFNGFAGQLNFNYQNQAYALSLQGGTFAVNRLVNGNIDYGTNYVSGYVNIGNQSLTGQTVVTPATAAVPEPATWAMMVLGFGFVGYTMRRRRATVRLSHAS